jgi:hypothetical protein
VISFRTGSSQCVSSLVHKEASRASEDGFQEMSPVRNVVNPEVIKADKLSDDDA